MSEKLLKELLQKLVGLESQLTKMAKFVEARDAIFKTKKQVATYLNVDYNLICDIIRNNDIPGQMLRSSTDIKYSMEDVRKIENIIKEKNAIQANAA